MHGPEDGLWRAAAGTTNEEHAFGADEQGLLSSSSGRGLAGIVCRMRAPSLDRSGVDVSFRDKRTRDFTAGKRVKACSGFERSARLKLDRMEAAASLRDLAALPRNRFEALVGDRKGQYSIRIKDQWRICSEWTDRSPDPSNVEIVDPSSPVGSPGPLARFTSPRCALHAQVRRP
jgi:proteic killer suppression protein